MDLSKNTQLRPLEHTLLAMVFYVIEFLDELICGVLDAAWPAIKTGLQLSYTQIGILLTVPAIFSAVVEPFLGVMADLWRRRALILGGGVFFVIALLLTGLSSNFLLLLLAFILFYPASGAFVSLSQASLMDQNPGRHEHSMARWTFTGSLGVVAGPPLLVGVSAVGFGWRGAFLALAFMAGVILFFAWRKIPADPAHQRPLPALPSLFKSFQDAASATRQAGVLRWLVLLMFSDLMLDVLLGFLALYFSNVVGLTNSMAAGAVFIWLAAGLVGDLLLIPLLEKVDGLVYLRISVVLELLLFPGFLLCPWPWLKLVLVGLLGFFNAGWYAILKGRLYSTLPGRSGTVMALDSIVHLASSLLPFTIGLAADAYGLQSAIWLLLAGPLALLFGLPSRNRIRSMPGNDRGMEH